MPDDVAPPFHEPGDDELPAIVESLLFVADAPVTEAALARALGTAPRKLRDALERLGEALEGRGIRLQRGPEGVQLITAPGSAAAVEHFLGLESGRRLSTAALETLAVVAYRQPVTAPEIAEIRGVNAAGVLGTLVERHLVKVVGRKHVVGRPFLYGTTREFLERFGLNDLSDLPKVEDVSELLGFDLPESVGAPQPQTALPFEGDDTVH